MHLAGDTSTYQRINRAATVSLHAIWLFFKTILFTDDAVAIIVFSDIHRRVEQKPARCFLFSPKSKGGYQS